MTMRCQFHACNALSEKSQSTELLCAALPNCFPRVHPSHGFDPKDFVTISTTAREPCSEPPPRFPQSVGQLRVRLRSSIFTVSLAISPDGNLIRH